MKRTTPPPLFRTSAALSIELDVEVELVDDDTDPDAPSLRILRARIDRALDKVLRDRGTVDDGYVVGTYGTSARSRPD